MQSELNLMMVADANRAYRCQWVYVNKNNCLVSRPMVQTIHYCAPLAFFTFKVPDPAVKIILTIDLNFKETRFHCKLCNYYNYIETK